MSKLKIAAVSLLLLIGVSAVGCGPNGNGSAAPTSSGQTTTLPAASATPADPLEGSWHQTFTCEERVRTFQRKLASWVRQGLPTGEDATLSVAALSKKYADFAAWGPNAKTATTTTPDALCKGAPERERIIHFQYGSLVIYNVWDQTEEMDGTYRIIDAHTFAATDQANIGGTSRFTFHLHGDRMTFKKVGKPEPWSDTYFEMAPFVRADD